MSKIKKIFKKWVENFMIDPIFNIIMYGLCGLLIYLSILLFIILLKKVNGIC